MKDWVARYWLEVLFGLVTTTFGVISKSLWNKVQADKNDRVLIREGLIALQHDRLYQMCNYWLSKGKITVTGLENLEVVYASYHSLGGNHTGTTLHERCKSLPVVPDDYDNGIQI